MQDHRCNSMFTGNNPYKLGRVVWDEATDWTTKGREDGAHSDFVIDLTAFAANDERFLEIDSGGSS